MSWIVEYLPEAKDDLQKLDHAAQVQVLKGIDKVAVMENRLVTRETSTSQLF